MGIVIKSGDTIHISVHIAAYAVDTNLVNV